MKSLTSLTFRDTLFCADRSETGDLLLAAAEARESCMKHGTVVHVSDKDFLSLVLMRRHQTWQECGAIVKIECGRLFLYPIFAHPIPNGSRLEVVTTGPFLRMNTVLASHRYRNRQTTRWEEPKLRSERVPTIVYIKSFVESVSDNWQKYSSTVLGQWEVIQNESRGGTIILVDYYISGGDGRRASAEACPPFIASLSLEENEARPLRQLSTDWTRLADPPVDTWNSCDDRLATYRRVLPMRPHAYEAKSEWSKKCTLPAWARVHLRGLFRGTPSSIRLDDYVYFIEMVSGSLELVHAV